MSLQPPEKLRSSIEDKFWIRDEEIEKLKQQVLHLLRAGHKEAYGSITTTIQLRVVGRKQDGELDVHIAHPDEPWQIGHDPVSHVSTTTQSVFCL